MPALLRARQPGKRARVVLSGTTRSCCRMSVFFVVTDTEGVARGRQNLNSHIAAWHVVPTRWHGRGPAPIFFDLPARDRFQSTQTAAMPHRKVLRQLSATADARPHISRK